MPLVRIDIDSNARAGLAKDIGELVYRAMLEEINVPEDDRFQILASHASNQLIYPKSYLGIEYSADIVFIQITLNQGRSTDLKKQFYKRIADDCTNQLGLRQQDIFISLIEVNKENWSFGNGEMQYGPTL